MPSVIHPSAHVQAIASPAFINLGNTSSFTALVTGGRPWFEYAWSALPPGCAAGNVSTFSCVPTQVGNYSVAVSVTDSTAKVSSGIALLEVNSSSAPVTTAPPTVTVLASPEYLTIGNSTDFVALISGGRPWFQYSWSPLPPGCTTGNSSILVCRPTSIGTFSAGVTLTDSQGRVTTNSTEVVVNASASAPDSSSNAPGGVFNITPSLYLFAGLFGIATAVVTAALILLVLRRRRSPPRPPPPPPVPSSQRLYIPPSEPNLSDPET